MKTIVLGGSGMLGNALLRRIPNSINLSSKEVDLTNYEEVNMAFRFLQPKTIWHCAGLVGGIGDNISRPYDYLMQNSLMATNAIRAALENKVSDFYYVASSCMYPAECAQPMKEDMLWTGKLEETNRGYAVAKLLGTEMCRSVREQHRLHGISSNYRTFIPCNLYGVGDNFGERGHAFASIVRQVCQAKKDGKRTVELWGDGTPRREYLSADDAADAMLFAINNAPDGLPGEINIGSGTDISIRDLAMKIAEVAEWDGAFEFEEDSTLNGMKQKLLDISFMESIGWKPSMTLQAGILQMIKTYEQYWLE